MGLVGKAGRNSLIRCASRNEKPLITAMGIYFSKRSGANSGLSKSGPLCQAGRLKKQGLSIFNRNSSNRF
jgi:hypothetical protein